MKILYHHRTRGDGAEGIHVAEVIGSFRKLGHDVALLCPKDAQRSPGLSTNNKAATTSAVFLLLRQIAEIFYNLVIFGRVWSGIKSNQPDFIYERYSRFSFAGVMVAKWKKVPLILEVNATYAGKFGARFRVFFPSTLRRIERYAFRNASGIVVVSRPLKSCIRSISNVPIVVCPNAINIGRVKETNRETERARHRDVLKLNGAIVIGFVGSLRIWHDIDFFASVLPDIASNVPNVHFLFVGNGEYEEELRRTVEENGLLSRVTFLGAVPHSEVYSLVAAMDVGVMPDSNLFGSPMKILEYMAMGCVPVGPNLAPVEELIRHGETGFVFERRNRDSIIEQLTALCENKELREKIGHAARKYVLEERTWDRNAVDAIQLYERVKGN